MLSARKSTSTLVASPRHLFGAGVILVAIISIVLWLFSRRWRAPAWDLPSQPGGWWGALLFVGLSAVLHELLHVVAWCVLGRVRWSGVSFIPTWRGLGLVALLNTPVSMSTYRVAAFFPAFVLGIVPLCVAFLTGSGLAVLWGAFLLFECITDVALVAATCAIPSAARVVSHPIELGCIVTTDMPGDFVRRQSVPP